MAQSSNGRERLLLVGGGGHCRSCIEAVESTQKYDIVGIVDLPERRETTVLGYRIIGSDDDLSELIADVDVVLITLGTIRTSAKRPRLYEQVRSHGGDFPVVVASTARVSSHASIGKGTIVMHGAVVNAGARVGENCILNTGSIVEHDSVVGSHCHVSTGAIVNGCCTIGVNVFVGSSAVLRNGISICSNVTIGMGAAIVEDILEAGTYVGVPGRRTNG